MVDRNVVVCLLIAAFIPLCIFRIRLFLLAIFSLRYLCRHKDGNPLSFLRKCLQLHFPELQKLMLIKPIDGFLKLDAPEGLAEVVPILDEFVVVELVERRALRLVLRFVLLHLYIILWIDSKY